MTQLCVESIAGRRIVKVGLYAILSLQVLVKVLPILFS